MDTTACCRQQLQLEEMWQMLPTPCPSARQAMLNCAGQISAAFNKQPSADHDITSAAARPATCCRAEHLSEVVVCRQERCAAKHLGWHWNGCLRDRETCAKSASRISIGYANNCLLRFPSPATFGSVATVLALSTPMPAIFPSALTQCICT